MSIDPYLFLSEIVALVDSEIFQIFGSLEARGSYVKDTDSLTNCDK